MVPFDRRLAGGAALVLVVLAGCAAPGALPPGTPIADARKSLGGVSGEYPLPDGGTRLEFRQGNFGKQTFMLDFDAKGALVSSKQVLTPETFATITPGLTSEQVLMRIGHPAFVVPVGTGGEQELEDRLRQHVRQRLGGNKTPRAFHFVESLPRTATGKIQYFKLRELAQQD